MNRAGCCGMDSSGYDRDPWLALTNTAMDLGFHKMQGNS
jgi:hypothetical protein